MYCKQFKIWIDINVQNVMNEYYVRREDDLGRVKKKQCVFRLRLKISMVWDERISRDIQFQMTGLAEQKEREPNLVLGGV